MVYSNLSRWFYLTIIIIGGSLIYCILTAVSWSMFLGPFGPPDNYLSQLGNSSLNPEGAIYYNVALLIAGPVVILFFIGVYVSYSSEISNTGFKVILIAALIAGIVNGITILMSDIYSEDYPDEHFFWGLLIFLTLVPVLFLTNISLWEHKWFSKPVGFYGLILGTFDMMFVLYVVSIGALSSGAILEWVSVFGFILWVVSFSIQTYRVEQSSIA